MQNFDLAQFGNRIKELRLSKGLSQQGLSDKCELDRSYLSDIERGLRNVSLENIFRLAEAFEVPLFQLFLKTGNLYERWNINLNELEDLIKSNPSLRGFILGYMAEDKLRRMLVNDTRLSDLRKFDDHDRNNKHDLVVNYKGLDFTIETKSLQTATVKKGVKDGIELQARFQCDASDKRKIVTKDGEVVETTCLAHGDFDILAVNMFAFRERWDFAFALNRDLPSSQYKKYPEEVRKKLIKSIIPIHLPLEHPFYPDLFVLLEQLYQERVSS